MDAYQEYFSNRPTTEIAQDLLGRLLTYDSDQGHFAGYIVETEAYLGVHDSASHAYNQRRTNYSESLYGDPGDLYIYQIRANYCFDVVVQARDEPQGILIRAIEPVENRDQMAINRHQTGVNLTNGPGKVMQAFGIQDRHLDGMPMVSAPLKIDLLQRRQPRQIMVTPRIGVNQAGDSGQDLCRFYVLGNPYVSKTKRRDDDRDQHGWIK